MVQVDRLKVLVDVLPLFHESAQRSRRDVDVSDRAANLQGAIATPVPRDLLGDFADHSYVDFTLSSVANAIDNGIHPGQYALHANRDQAYTGEGGGRTLARSRTSSDQASAQGVHASTNST